MGGRLGDFFTEDARQRFAKNSIRVGSVIKLYDKITELNEILAQK